MALHTKMRCPVPRIPKALATLAVCFSLAVVKLLAGSELVQERPSISLPFP